MKFNLLTAPPPLPNLDNLPFQLTGGKLIPLPSPRISTNLFLGGSQNRQKLQVQLKTPANELMSEIVADKTKLFEVKDFKLDCRKGLYCKKRTFVVSF
jgi:hypothetical protein